ncbi:hypothetical protein [Moraxella catarrhalis]|uniref:Uncharacterized protein n=1 Tax=Moraxella catarrhalis TaxID=480 RepID=A0A198UNJ5_MORCA|nr:hypothetical protein AO385_2039 [Moraxella catarrhalis]OAU95849.1 hypothetical protein AO383_1726 [Moraxella catarrhalis]OAU97921.1 hypothetical protein AO384_0168 [Moraxella catarrhalis]
MILALVYNPMTKVYFSKEIWSIVMVHLHKSDMGIIFVYFYYNLGSVISNNTLKNKISFLFFITMNCVIFNKL